MIETWQLQFFIYSKQEAFLYRKTCLMLVTGWQKMVHSF